MKTGTACIGALVGAALATAVFLLLGPGWPVVAIAGGLVLPGYVVAHFTATTTCGELTRGLLLGWNSGWNAVFAHLAYGALLGSPGGMALGTGSGLLNLAAVLPPVSGNAVYQAVLGWLCALQPMSWLVVGVGVVMFAGNLLGHLVHLAARWRPFRVTGFRVDWKTGTFFVRGGFVSNLNPIDTAFNMGNVSFVDDASPGWPIDHEAGHTLNLAAFGSLFHLVGAVDENLTGGHANAFAERLAESNVPATSQANIIPMWQ